MSDTPTDYPTWRFYADGHTVIVHTPEELAALPPGHAGSPAGPFPDPAAPAEEAEPPPDQRARAQALRDDGLSRRAIAEALGITEYSVRRLLEDP